MEKKTTFKSLAVLKEAQVLVKRDLAEKYEAIVEPYVTIIEMIMKANNIDQFEALKIIKEKNSLYKKPDGPFLFSAAVMEIVDKKLFSGQKKRIVRSSCCTQKQSFTICNWNCRYWKK